MSRWRSGLASGSRALTEGETALGRSIFADLVDFDRIRIIRRSWGAPAIVFGSTITFPPSTGAPEDFAAEGLQERAWLVHELTHVWQFQTNALATLWSWAGVVLSGGYGRGLPGYRYALPLKEWETYNLEQQASLVEHADLLSLTGSCVRAPAGRRSAITGRAFLSGSNPSPSHAPRGPLPLPRGERGIISGSGPGSRRGSRRSRGRPSCRASRPPRTSPGGGRAGTSNPPGPRAARS